MHMYANVNFDAAAAADAKANFGCPPARGLRVKQLII